jgi:ribose transport system ATP-binding protein
LTLLGADQSWTSEEAEEAGVILIHQEFNLAEQMTVEESIFLGREITKGLFLNKAEMRRLSGEYLQALDCMADPSARIHDLPIADKQMVEIAKATSRNAKVLILDEPTAVLTGKETEVLFKLIERLKAQGVAIVYISHKLEEIERIADKITILRDGTWVGSYPAKDLSKDDMARLMVGRELKDLYPEIIPPAKEAPIALSVQDFSSPGQFDGAGFELRKGEVLGFAGLVGAGRTALMEAIVGLDAQSSGTLELNGKSVEFSGLGDARSHGVAYLTKDRKEKGLLQSLGMCPNFSLFSLHKFSNLLIDGAKEREAFSAAVKTFDIRAGDLTVNAGSLSGGNQQKLLLAKIMEVAPQVVIIDEPTRGIDVGTKSQIYHFISELAASGHSIILLSSEMTEIIGLSHRVAVMYAGHLTAVLEGDDIEEHEIMRYATGLKGT